MKRSPLKRGTTRLKRTRLASTSSKARQRHDPGADYSKAKSSARARSGGRCELAAATECTGIASDMAGPHHRWMRSQGGVDEPWNLRDCCSPCHRYVHEVGAAAYEHGWLLHAWDDEVKEHQ